MWTPKIPEPIGLQVIIIDCDAVIMQCSTVKVKREFLHKVALLQLLNGFT